VTGGETNSVRAPRSEVMKAGRWWAQAGGAVDCGGGPGAECMETGHKSGAIRRAAGEAAGFRGNRN